MPRVPVYDRQRVAPSALPSPRLRAPRSDGLEQLGGAVRQAGQTGYDLAIDFRDRADQLRADRALLDFNARRQQLSTGENGVLLRQGENALDFSADWQDLERTRGEIAAGLANDRQRALFLQRADPLMLQTQGAWEKHSFQQFNTVYGQVAEGRMQQALDEATASALDGPEVVEQALQRVLVDPPDAEGNPQPGILRRYLTLVQGLPAERVDQLVDRFRKDGHLRALRSLMQPGAENVDAAQAYLRQVGDLLGKDADPIRRAIDTEIRKRKALNAASEVITQSMRAPREGAEERVDPNAAMAALDELPPDERDAARPYVLQQIQDAERAWKARVLEHEDTAWMYLDQGGLRAIPASVSSWLQVNAPQTWRKIRDEAQRRHDAWLKRQRGQRTETEDEIQALVELRADMAERPGFYAGLSDSEFQSMWRHRLSDSGYKTGGTLLAQVKKASGAKLEVFKQAVNTKMAEEGISSKKNQQQFRSYMTERYLDYMETHGKAPGLGEINTWLDDATEQVVLKAWVGTRRRQAWQLRPGDEERIVRRERGEATGTSDDEALVSQERVTIDRVPPGIQERIVRDFQAKYNTTARPSDAVIISVYQAGVRGGVWQ